MSDYSAKIEGVDAVIEKEAAGTTIEEQTNRARAYMEHVSASDKKDK